MRTFKSRLSNAVQQVVLSVVCCLALALAEYRPASADEYRLSAGDKLRISVYGQKDLDHVSSVDLNGRLWFPTVGRIAAADLTLDDVHSKISKILTANNAIRPEDINIEVVEFRPFYIAGGVAKPGSYPFVPSLNVRQAIALAGGLASPSSENLSTLLQSDPRSSYASILTEYLHRVARSGRLRAELEQKPSFEWQPHQGFSISPEVVTQIYEFQNSEFQARAEKFAREKQDFEELIELAKNEVAALQQQDERLAAEDVRVTKSLAEMRKLKERGVVSLARIDESQRDVFSSRYARDSTRSQLAGARSRQAELVSKKEQMGFVRREDVTREINLVNSEIDVLQAQLANVAAKAELTGNPIERYCALENKEQGLFINRPDRGRNNRFAATEDSDVRPGDTVEVNVVSELLSLTCRAKKAAGGNVPGVRTGTQ